MKEMNYRRLVAAAILLFTGCLVQAKDHNTITVTSETTQIITTAVISPETITDTLQPLTTAAPNPPPTPLPTLPPAQTVPPLAPPSPVGGNPAEVLLTLAFQQAALVNLASALGDNGPQGVITIQTGNAVLAPAATTPGSTSRPTATAGSAITGSQTAVAQGPPQGPVDLAQGGFLGGNPPNTTVDLPVTIFFLLLFIAGAITHISIYRANAKRGHKFLLSDLMFDFCMVRTVTCIFRIIWVFIQPRGVVLAAQIFFNGGASVIFAVNIFLVQRIVRSMHPKFGWSTPFSIVTRVMAISVPAIIILQIVSIIFLFFSTDDQSRFNAFDGVLKFGASYLMVLATFPFWAIFLACSIPGPKPEKFGVGHLRVKTSLVMVAAVMLTTGATVRTYAFFNPRPIDNDDVLYGKPVFYTTQFMLEILVVAGYALIRFDLLFHIPNGASGPGDYSAAMTSDTEKGHVFTRWNIEERIAASGIPHQILAASYSKSTVDARADQPVYAVFFPQASNAAGPREEDDEARLPPRPPRRVSRRDTLIEYMQQRPLSMGRRPSFDTFYDDGRGPPIPRSSTYDPYNVAPDYKFTRPRKPPTPPGL